MRPENAMAHLPPPPVKYKAVLLGGAALLVFLVLGAIVGDRGLLDLQRLRAEQRRLEQTVFHQQQANAQLREHIQHLRADDRYLERWARQRLRWARPGEIIYRFRAEPSKRIEVAPATDAPTLPR
jgi:cell division protein FtsB